MKLLLNLLTFVGFVGALLCFAAAIVFLVECAAWLLTGAFSASFALWLARLWMTGVLSIVVSFGGMLLVFSLDKKALA